MAADAGDLVQASWRGWLAVTGLILPYAVGILVVVSNASSIGNYNYYVSGRLREWDDLTSLLTLGAVIVGFCACLPWISRHGKNSRSKKRMILALLICIAPFLQLIGVFLVRFLVYNAMGGIL